MTQPESQVSPVGGGVQAAPKASAASAPVPPVVRGIRIVRAALWALLLVTIVGMIALKLLVPKPSNLPVLFPAARFTLTDQNARTFSSDGLHGRPWVGAFIFTTCGDVCPRMTRTMAGLQKQLPADVQLVSFSVDPDHDTPDVLKQYAVENHADESRWHFITGPRQGVMDVVATMKLAFAPAERNNPILHSDKLLLVDADGQVRGDYRSDDPEEMKQLVSDAAALTRDAKRGKLMKWLSDLAATNQAPRRGLGS